MNASQEQVSKLDQLAEFRSSFVQAALSVAIAFVLIALIFGIILGRAGVFTELSEVIDPTAYPAYIVTAAVSWVLYITVRHIKRTERGGDEADETSGSVAEAYRDVQSNESIGKTVYESYKKTFKGFAVMTYVTILISFGAFAGLIVSTYLSPALGPLVALCYPIFDYKINDNYHWYWSPALLALVLTYVVLVPMSALVTFAGTVAGLLLGVTIGVPIVVLRFLWESYNSAGLDEIVQKPFSSLKRRQGHL